MEHGEIDKLRELVAEAKAEDARVLWFDVDGNCKTVVAVPRTPMDIDKTGIASFVALLGNGGTWNAHVDLDNVEPGSFMVARPAFNPEPAAAPAP